jgi:hypothetical protein
MISLTFAMLPRYATGNKKPKVFHTLSNRETIEYVAQWDVKRNQVADRKRRRRLAGHNHQPISAYPIPLTRTATLPETPRPQTTQVVTLAEDVVTICSPIELPSDEGRPLSGKSLCRLAPSHTMVV